MIDIYLFKRFLITLGYLKSRQILYRIKYKLFNAKRKRCSTGLVFKGNVKDVFPRKRRFFYGTNGIWTFSFLNVKHSFQETNMNWSYTKSGMLWAYNLNYFECLCQNDISEREGLKLLKSYYSGPFKNNPFIVHAYPTSVRIINVSKFISRFKIEYDWLYDELVADITVVFNRLEYHLLANHLLENAIALYVGGLTTDQPKFLLKGRKLLVRELREQILNDGMHYERSPMYHLIILERLLDALHFSRSYEDDLEPVLKAYAVKMTGLAMNWQGLERIPMMQDSAYDIAMTVPEVLRYSESLLGEEYPTTPNVLKGSNYRRLIRGNFIAFVNVGSIGPSYQPGHAHADELNFELFFKGSPIIVDTGVSTYEKNYRRHEERSTVSHNCLTIDDKNSSDVWSGFRVAKRAHVKLLNDVDFIKATHDGYEDFAVSRTWRDSSNGEVTIIDQIEKYNSEKTALFKGRLHFHPDLSLYVRENRIINVGNELSIEFHFSLGENPKLAIGEYYYAHGYNKLRKAKTVTYFCRDQIKITIRESN